MVRFDGVRFTTFRAGSDGLESSTIQDLQVDSDGSLWVATLGGGISHLVRGHFRTFTTKDGLPSDDIMALYRTQDGRLWIGTREGKIARLTEDGIETLPIKLPPIPVNSFFEKDGDVWFSTFGAGVYRIRGDKLENFTMENGLAHNRLTGLCQDHDGKLWATGVKGVSYWNGSGFVVDELINREVIYAIGCMVDRDKNMWISASTGLYRVSNGHLAKMDQKLGLSADFTSDAMEDREGNLWAATRGGLDRLRDAPIRIFTEREGAVKNPGPILRGEGGSIWTASSEGVTRIVGGRATTWPTRIPGKPMPLTMLAMGGERLFIGSDNGGYLWTPNRTTPVPALASLQVSCALRSRDGSIFLATRNRGLFRWNGPQLRFTGLRDNSIATLAEDNDGVLWAGANTGGGLYRLKGDQIDNFGRDQGLRSPNVYSLLITDDGRLWIGSVGGLSWFHRGVLHTVGSQAGLPSDQVFALAEDANERLWMVGYGGIFSIERQSLDAYAEGKVSRLNPTIHGRSDGVRIIAMVTRGYPHSLRTDNGDLYFPSATGLVEVEPPPPGRARGNAFPVLIEQVSVDGATQASEDSLRISPGARSLAIEYSALNFASPEALHFRYKLEPVDSDWVNVGTRRTAYYNDLRPGEYVFRVSASSSEGHWHDSPTLRIRQLPFFYQTWWFAAAMFAVVGSAAWTLYNLKVQNALSKIRVRSEERALERIRIAQELHDTVVQAISGSTMIVENATEKVPDSMPVVKGSLLRALDQLDLALSQSRTALAGLRDTVSDVNDLPRALAAIQAQHRSSAEVSLSVTGESDALDPLVRYEVFRIASEAIANAMQHSDARSIQVDISYVDGLRLTVRDDGRGVEEDLLVQGRKGHFGIRGMKERAKQIGASLDLFSRPGHGTEVRLAVPAEIAFPAKASSGGRFKKLIAFLKRSRMR
ncbi:MAG: hypothetical protein K2X03_11185 [Bryobacteraceae bacterium]|nr:hypothetical protein [Bryobacteraceae bacterium]